MVPYDQYMESINNNYSIGMRFKMRFDGEEAPEQSDWRHSEYHFGPDINICIQDEGYGCSHCSCFLSNKLAFYHHISRICNLSRFFKNGILLLMRVIPATFCVTLATSMSASLGSTQMAAFQICLQVWLAASLLSDGLAVAGQAILAGAFARQDCEGAKAIALVHFK